MVHSNSIETTCNEEQTVTCERSANFISGSSTIHVENNETVFAEEQLARSEGFYLLSTFPIAHVYGTMTTFTGDQLESQQAL